MDFIAVNNDDTSGTKVTTMWKPVEGSQRGRLFSILSFAW